MSKFNVNTITSKSGSNGPVLAGITTVNSTGSMRIPSGPTEHRGGRGRGVFNSSNPSPGTLTLEKIEIATTGNATDFGDTTKSRALAAGCASATRGIYMGGQPGASPYYVTNIDYVIISSGGGASVFGDLTQAGNNSIDARRGSACGSNDSTRGLIAGGNTPGDGGARKEIEFITMATTGDSSDFGELTVGRAFFNSVGSSTRSVTGGGENGPRVDTMDYFTIQASGNAVDFGNLSAARTAVFSVSSSTRGVWGGGEESGGNVNTMEFIEISTTGNAVDFGDRIITTKQGNCGLVNSPTRGIFAGGPYWADDIDMITIAAKGNSISFGELSDHRKGFASCSNSSRGIFICGESKSGSNIDTLDYITIATQGNAIDFGNASSSRVYVSGVSNGTRGVWSGGATALNIIEYVNFATLGDAIDFGDLALGRRGAAGSSDSHGGLGGF